MLQLAPGSINEVKARMEAFWEIFLSIMSLRTYLSNHRKWFTPNLEFAYTVTPVGRKHKKEFLRH